MIWANFGKTFSRDIWSKSRLACWKKNSTNFWGECTSPKTNMDTQNDGLKKLDSFKIWSIFGIYVRFLGCPHFVCIFFWKEIDKIQPDFTHETCGNWSGAKLLLSRHGSIGGSASMYEGAFGGGKGEIFTVWIDSYVGTGVVIQFA